ncbi:hypothetical protein AC1031_018133 [Aphanomyces cochlioides]|nr:hypothetical protein AC1031_018133 [Aphanomyces cochlioides]
MPADLSLLSLRELLETVYHRVEVLEDQVARLSDELRSTRSPSSVSKRQALPESRATNVGVTVGDNNAKALQDVNAISKETTHEVTGTSSPQPVDSKSTSPASKRVSLPPVDVISIDSSMSETISPSSSVSDEAWNTRTKANVPNATPTRRTARRLHQAEPLQSSKRRRAVESDSTLISNAKHDKPSAHDGWFVWSSGVSRRVPEKWVFPLCTCDVLWMKWFQGDAAAGIGPFSSLTIDDLPGTTCKIHLYYGRNVMEELVKTAVDHLIVDSRAAILAKSALPAELKAIFTQTFQRLMEKLKLPNGEAAANLQYAAVYHLIVGTQRQRTSVGYAV